MKKRILFIPFAIFLSVVGLVLTGCGDNTPGGTDTSKVAGTYYLTSQEFSETDAGGKVTSEKTTDADFGRDYCVFKVKSDNKYLLKVGDNSFSGTWQLTDGILKITGFEDQMFGGGSPDSLTASFAVTENNITWTATAVQDGISYKATFIFVRGSEADDSLFEDKKPDEERKIVDVGDLRGVESEYLPGEFGTGGITFAVTYSDGKSERLPLEEAVAENEAERYAVGEHSLYFTYEGFKLPLSYKIVSFDLKLSDLEVEWSPDGVTYEIPDIPDGFFCEYSGETTFYETGEYNISGALYGDGHNFVENIDFRLKVTPRKVQVPAGDFRYEYNGENQMPAELTDNAAFNCEYKEIVDAGEYDVELNLKNSNYCWEDGTTDGKTVVVTVAPKRVDTSDWYWTGEREGTYGRIKYPRLEGNGTEFAAINYSIDGEDMAEWCESVGKHTIAAQLDGNNFVFDHIEPFVFEILPRYIPRPVIENKEFEYDGTGVNLWDNFTEEQRQFLNIEGDTYATEPGKYQLTVAIKGEHAGNILWEDGTDGKFVVDWSIKKLTREISVDTDSFDNGLSFDYDGTDRKITVDAGDLSYRVYVNDRYVDASQFGFIEPGTYNVRVSADSSIYDVKDVEFTVVISKAKIALSEQNVVWQTEREFTYDKSWHSVFLETCPDQVVPEYMHNFATDAGNYVAKAAFTLIDDTRYELADPDYMSEIVWTIARLSVAKPLAAQNKFVYDGTEKQFLYDNEEWTVSANKGTDAGKYTAVLSLMSNYCWADGGIEDARMDWEILPCSITVMYPPYWTQVYYEYSPEGAVNQFIAASLESYYDFTLSGNSGLLPGDYTAVAACRVKPEYQGNYEFVKANTQDVYADEFEVVCEWHILKMFLPMPRAVGVYGYTGLEQTFMIENFDPALMSKSGGTGKDAGTYTISVSCMDPLIYAFRDTDYNEMSEVTLEFEIYKAGLDLTSGAPLVGIYDGQKHYAEYFYNGMNGETFDADIEYIYSDSSGGASSLVDGMLDAGYYTLNISLPEQKNYYEVSPHTISHTIRRRNVDKTLVTWDFSGVVYDGAEHAPSITGGLPDEVSVESYSVYIFDGGSFIASPGERAGRYCVYAECPETRNYNGASIYHEFEIMRKPVPVPVFGDLSFVYDGSLKTVEYTQSEVYDVLVSGESAQNAGNYTLYLWIGNNYIWPDNVTEITKNWTIEKAQHDFSNVRWSGENGKEYPSDGTFYQFVMEGLPDTVTYDLTGDIRVALPGDYRLTVSVTSKDPANYVDPVLPEGLDAFTFKIGYAEFGDFDYYVDGGTTYIVKYNGSGRNVVVPDELCKNYSTMIEANAFAGDPSMVSLNAGKAYVQENALAGCDRLQSLSVKSLSQRRLGRVFGGESGVTPASLKYLTITQTLAVKEGDIDAPSLEELRILGQYYNNTYVDLSGLPCVLRYLEIHSGIANGQTATLRLGGYTELQNTVIVVNGLITNNGGSPISSFNCRYNDKEVIAVDGNVYIQNGDAGVSLIYAGNAEYVEIPESVVSKGQTYSVTAVSPYAFHGCTATEVTIPSSVITIGFRSFGAVDRLSKLTLPFIGSTLNGTTDTDFGYIFGLGFNPYELPALLKTVVITGGDTIAENAFDKCGQLTSITISANITSIGDRAFYNCTNLGEFVIPDSVISIGDYAFYDCTGLTKITIPEGVETIGGSAFYNCTGLTNVDIPESVTTIGYSAFRGSGLTSITIRSGVTCLEYSAFSDCPYLTEIRWNAVQCSRSGVAFENCPAVRTLTFGAGVKAIPDNAFSSLNGLTSVTIPDGVTSIGKNAFDGCAGLTKISMPESVTVIGESAFANATALKSITVPEKVVSVGRYAFSGCSSLTEIVWNAAEISAAAYGVFDGCNAVSKITFGENVKVVAENLFRNMLAVTELIIPDSVTTIGNYAFFSCTGLMRVTLGRGLTSFGDNAFGNCYRLIEVRNLSELNLTAGKYGNGNVAVYARHIYSQGDSRIVRTAAGFVFYKAADGARLINYTGGEKDIILPENYEGGSYAIHNYAFYNLDKITGVSIPGSVTLIGDSAFENCTGLITLTIPGSVISIGNSTFKNCTGLISLTISEGVTSIGSAFENCKSLRSLSLPRSVTWIHYYAFKNCTGLESINVDPANENYLGAGNCLINKNTKILMLGCNNSIIPADGSVIQIGSYAFRGCTGLTSIMIPDGVTSIDNDAFDGCTGLTSITIPNSVTSIGDSAFRGCTDIIELENGVSYVGNWAIDCDSSVASVILRTDTVGIAYEAFLGCNQLTDITIPNGVISINYSAFRSCTGLTSITIPDSVTLIGSDAFRGCTGLTSIAIPDSVTSIGSSAFSGCTGLTSITIPDSVTSIGSSVFSGCADIIEIENGVSYVGKWAVDCDENVTSVTLRADTVGVANSAFYGCIDLKGIVIPTSVKYIGNMAFYSCEKLSCVYYAGTAADWHISISYDNTAFERALRYYYSENQPTKLGNYWHYVNGVPTVWAT